jgi:hypothetical protein
MLRTQLKPDGTMNYSAGNNVFCKNSKMLAIKIVQGEQLKESSSKRRNGAKFEN